MYLFLYTQMVVNVRLNLFIYKFLIKGGERGIPKKWPFEDLYTLLQKYFLNYNKRKFNYIINKISL